MPTYFTDLETNVAHKIGTVYKGNIKIGQIYKGNKLVYQSAFRITYVIDTDREYVEKVVPKKTILLPKTFTPAKEGWTFVGWRSDKTASSSVLTEAYSTGHTTLYAVFKQTVTCKFISNGTQTASGTRYYNNGNLVNATITVPNGVGRSSYSWRGWSAAGDTGAAASVKYANGAKISGLEKGYTYYGLYHRSYTLATSWGCGYCGHTFSGNSHPTYCNNNACWNNEHPTSNWHVKSSKKYNVYLSGSGNSVTYS